MFYKVSLYVLLFFLLSACKQDPPATPVYKDWTVYNTFNSGLPENNISGPMVIDKNDILWIGSNGKLIKFDGYNWENIAIPDNLDKFGNPRGINIALDQVNNIWICLYGKGILKFDGINWTIFNTLNSDIPSDYIASIAIDSNNKLWAISSGLVEYDGAVWKSYNMSNSEITGDELLTIAIDIDNSIWISTIEHPIDPKPKTALVHYINNTWEIYTTNNSGLPGNWVRNIKIEKNGKKWFLTGGGIASFNGFYWQVHKPPYEETLTVRSIFIDSRNIKWFSTSKGLLKYNEKEWIFYDSENSGLPVNRITSIVEDSKGNLWIATTNGLAKFKINN